MSKTPKQLSLEEETWDKPKIAIALIVVILLVVVGIIAKNIYFPSKPSATKMERVNGISTENLSHFSLPSADDVNAKIQSIQAQVTHVKVSDIASSSPQIQQIILEIQSLPQLPGTLAKQACLQLCSKL